MSLRKTVHSCNTGKKLFIIFISQIEKPFTITSFLTQMKSFTGGSDGKDSACNEGDLDWIIKKAECQRNDAFELCCWRRLLRVPWTVRRSKKSILKKINPEYSLEGLMLKLKLQYFGHLMVRVDTLGKTLMPGNTEGRRRG